MLVNQKLSKSPNDLQLVDLMVPEDEYDELKAYASYLPSIQIPPGSVNDLEMIANGSFSPLDRFMDEKNYRHVLHDMRLADGVLFPAPIVLPVSPEADLHLDVDIAIRNSKYELIAIMTIEDIFHRERNDFVMDPLVSKYSGHPILEGNPDWGLINISGNMRVLQLPVHHDFPELWLSPPDIRERSTQFNSDMIVALQPIRAGLPDLEFISQSGLEASDAIFLLQLAGRKAALEDGDYFVRTQTYRELVKRYFPDGRVMLSLLPFSRRGTGMRDILLQAIIQRNFGATHILVSQSINGDQKTSHEEKNNGRNPEQILNEYSRELGLEVVPTKIQSDGQKFSNSRPLDQNVSGQLFDDPSISKTDKDSSPWSLFQQSAAHKLEQKRKEMGVCIWFTGLSGSGKSTTAEILSWKILELNRKVKILDGDVVRTHLSRGLGFSKADRDINVRRIGFVASMLVDLGGIVICAVVSPYRETRIEVREMIGSDRFVEVFVDTPLAVCEERDVKGMYAKARKGELKGFTGVDDPYEPPLRPEIKLDTVNRTPEQNAQLIKNYLIQRGVIQSNDS